MLSKRMIVIAVVILLVAVNVILLTITGKEKTAPAGFGQGALFILSPFQQQMTRLVDSVQGVWNQYFYLVGLTDENQRLKAELGLLTRQLNQCSEDALANQRLRHLLDFAPRIDTPMVAAQVVGRDPSPWSKTVVIDKGADAGVRQGAPVVVPEGVVGVVVEAAGGYAKVLLLIDPNSAVDALVQDSRARGIVKGGGEGICLFDYVLRKHEVSVGDTVISSGLDGVFPKGLRVGRVSEIVRKNAGIFQNVHVTPYVDFALLEEVFVIADPALANPSGKS